MLLFIDINNLSIILILGDNIEDGAFQGRGGTEKIGPALTLMGKRGIKL